jgi:hypothetical protein
LIYTKQNGELINFGKVLCSQTFFFLKRFTDLNLAINQFCIEHGLLVWKKTIMQTMSSFMFEQKWVEILSENEFILHLAHLGLAYKF